MGASAFVALWEPPHSESTGVAHCRANLLEVVSKWIGEKNLRRAFDAAEEGGAILLFDEAGSERAGLDHGCGARFEPTTFG